MLRVSVDVDDGLRWFCMYVWFLSFECQFVRLCVEFGLCVHEIVQVVMSIENCRFQGTFIIPNFIFQSCLCLRFDII